MVLVRDDGYYYILPICPWHNKRNMFDSPNGQQLTSNATAWAVQIEPD